MAHIYSKAQTENLSASDLKGLSTMASPIKLACRKEH